MRDGKESEARCSSAALSAAPPLEVRFLSICTGAKSCDGVLYRLCKRDTTDDSHVYAPPCTASTAELRESENSHASLVCASPDRFGAQGIGELPLPLLSPGSEQVRLRPTSAPSCVKNSDSGFWPGEAPIDIPGRGSESIQPRMTVPSAYNRAHSSVAVDTKSTTRLVG
jgi:hypothetical protein